jgi:uncharacterized protein
MYTTTTIKYVALCFLVLCFIPFVHARSGHITALAVIDENESRGGIADVYLEIKPGNGAVYIESFPLTQLDTQVSTRVAKEIACQRSRVDCTQYDFFYFINVHSSVVGGPSAGGAITVLTYAVLEDLPIDNTTAMTGAILSGGIIGPVGGVRGKVAAAAQNGYKRVLIPAWDNQTGIPLGDRYNIDIVRIRNIDEAISYFTGQVIATPPVIEPPEGYTKGMEEVSLTLCEHAHLLLDSLDATNASNTTLFALTQYERGVNETGRAAYYSAASLCFSSALVSQTELFTNKTSEQRREILEDIIADHRKLDEALTDKTLKTIADIEISMIVHERLRNVRDRLNTTNVTDPDPIDLAYSYERLETAHAWFSLLGKVESKEADITPERIEQSCRQKLEEAQERVNYISYIYPTVSRSVEESLGSAFDAAQEQDYLQCLLAASQAKAEANALLTALSVPAEEFKTVVREKLAVSRSQLARQQTSGTFPILSYSYSQYSESLLESEQYSASLYAEYSLELGMLDIYFPPRHNRMIVDTQLLLVFVSGAVLGALSALVISQLIERSRRPKKVTIARNLPGKKR